MLQDFFVHNLMGVEPPNWNGIEPGPAASSAEARVRN
jgi:hypothetical protein